MSLPTFAQRCIVEFEKSFFVSKGKLVVYISDLFFDRLHRIRSESVGNNVMFPPHRKSKWSKY